MKSLWLGLVPVVLFWFFEEKLGTFWGLVIALVWTIGECAWQYFKTKTLDRFTLVSGGLVVVLGGLSLLLDNSVFFKFQPSISEAAFAVILFFQFRADKTWLLKMALKHGKDKVQSLTPDQLRNREFMMVRLTRNLIYFLGIHSLIMLVFALKGSTGQWAFMKGIGFYALFGIWLAVEFYFMKNKKHHPRN